MDNPKCQFCGNKHRMGPEFCPALTGGSEPDKPKRVTNAVTRPSAEPEIVTQGVTHVTQGVTEKHCPTCRCQRVYKSNAEKQKAYRAKKKQK
jgi:hypothetical protein